MLKKSLLLLTLCLLLNFQPSYAAKSKPTQSEPQIEVFFSPHGGCTDAIVNALDKAKTSVLVQAYSFTSAPIAKAVVDAHKRGVKVNVILDKSQKTAAYSSADFLVISDNHSYLSATVNNAG